MKRPPSFLDHVRASLGHDSNFVDPLGIPEYGAPPRAQGADILAGQALFLLGEPPLDDHRSIASWNAVLSGDQHKRFLLIASFIADANDATGYERDLFALVAVTLAVGLRRRPVASSLSEILGQAVGRTPDYPFELRRGFRLLSALPHLDHALARAAADLAHGVPLADWPALRHCLARTVALEGDRLVVRGVPLGPSLGPSNERKAVQAVLSSHPDAVPLAALVPRRDGKHGSRVASRLKKRFPDVFETVRLDIGTQKGLRLAPGLRPPD